MITFFLIVLIALAIWNERKIRQLTQINRRIENKMAALDDQITALTAEVSNDTTVIGSAIALINGFAAQLAAAVAAAQAAGATPTQLQALTDLGSSLKTNDDALAAAVAQNTPAA